ncbi:MAG TPA: helix-turn-helix domain-containing protein [Methanocellaceae archaeon]
MSKKPNTGASDTISAPAVNFKNCPIKVTIGVLGKKWTILILRDIALLKINRFNQIRRSLPGLTSRVLIMRLHELEECGLIEAVVIKDKPRVVEWVLTEKGKDTVPIMKSIISFGAKWYADEVFEDGRARTMEEIYPDTARGM